jgi:hypothetical protein
MNAAYLYFLHKEGNWLMNLNTWYLPEVRHHNQMPRNKISEVFLQKEYDSWDLFFHALTYNALMQHGYGYDPKWGIDFLTHIMEYIYIQCGGVASLRLKIHYVKVVGNELKVTYELERQVGKRWFKHPIPSL